MKDNQKSTVAQHIVRQNIKLDYKSHSSVFSLLGGLSWREAQTMVMTISTMWISIMAQAYRRICLSKYVFPQT